MKICKQDISIYNIYIILHVFLSINQYIQHEKNEYNKLLLLYDHFNKFLNKFNMIIHPINQEIFL